MAGGEASDVFLKMKSDQREIDETSGEQSGGGDVDPEGAWEGSCGGDGVRFLRFEARRVRIEADGYRQHRYGEERWDSEKGVSARVLVGLCQDERDRQRTKERAGLVHEFVQAEAPAPSDHMRCVRQHHVTGGVANAFASALSDDQDGGDSPGVSEGQERYGEEVDYIANRGESPITARAVGRDSSSQAQQVASQLARAGHDADYRCTRAEPAEEWTVDAARAFVSHVGEEADGAEGDDEADSGAVRAGHQGRSAGCVQHTLTEAFRVWV
jgi:hypothetical protein